MNTDFLIGILLGGLVGAIATLFLTPKTGKEMRQWFQQTMTELRIRTQPIVEKIIFQIRVTAKNLQEKGRHTLANQLDRLSEAAQNSKKLIQGKGKQG